MIRLIVWKEFLEMTRDGRFRWTVATVLMLLAVATAAGWHDYRDRRQEQVMGQQTVREQYLNQGAKNPHGAAHYGIYAFKPQTPLSLIDSGVNPYAGMAIWLEAHKQNIARFRPAQDSLAHQRVVHVTAAGVMQLLIPLLILLLTFSAFAGEREQQTLRHALSLGVGKGTLGLGKGLGIAAALGLLVLPAAALGGVALAITSDTLARDGFFARLGFMILGYLVYFALFTVAGLFVSARASSSRAALLALLGFWLVSGLIVPRAAAELAIKLYPVPAAGEFFAALERDKNEGPEGSRQERREKLLREYLDKYGVSSEKELPVNFRGVDLQADEEFGYRIYDQRYAELQDIYRRQQRVLDGASLLSPLLAVRSFSMAMAGTDVEHHYHFAAAAESYRRDLIKRTNDTIMAYKGEAEQIVGREFFETVPDFHYSPPPAGWALRNSLVSGGLLVMGLIGFFCAVLAATRRMSVD